MSLTPWFIKGLRPAREGWYQTRFDWEEGEDGKIPYYSYWNGTYWSRSVIEPEVGELSRGAQDKIWRGLLKE